MVVMAALAEVVVMEGGVAAEEALEVEAEVVSEVDGSHLLVFYRGVKDRKGIAEPVISFLGL